MMFAKIDNPAVGRLRFVFNDSVVSLALAANPTLEDIAWTLGALEPRRAPVAIDVTLAPAPNPSATAKELVEF